MNADIEEMLTIDPPPDPSICRPTCFAHWKTPVRLIDFSAHNAVLQEQDLSLHDPEAGAGLQYLERPDTFAFEDGFVERPTGDGLGVAVDESYVRERAQADIHWQNPVWHYEDESLAEW